MPPQKFVNEPRTPVAPEIKRVESTIIEKHSAIREEKLLPIEQSAGASESLLEKVLPKQRPVVSIQSLGRPQVSETEVETRSLQSSSQLTESRLAEQGHTPQPLAPRPQPVTGLLEPRTPSPTTPFQSPPAVPTINVTIGRIEVKAYPKSRSAPRQSAPKAPVMSLETYLDMRSGEMHSGGKR